MARGTAAPLIADRSCSYLGVHWCVFLATHFLRLQQSAREQMHDCLTETGLYPEQPWSGEAGWVTQSSASALVGRAAAVEFRASAGPPSYLLRAVQPQANQCHLSET